MKLNYKYLPFFLLFFMTSFSQVGIGTVSPQGALDITSATNGMLVPRVLLTATNVSAPVVNPAGGALITGTLVYNTTASAAGPNAVIQGFYYWSGTIWVSITGQLSNAWTLGGNGGTTPGTNYLGTSDPTDLSISTNNTEKIRITSTGQIGMGIPTPDSSALLDVNSSNKGVSFPNVNLVSETDAATIATPKAGLMVYNTNVAMPCGKGLYFNNGTSAAPVWSCFTKTNQQYHAYNNATRATVTSTTPTLQPGCTINFTIPNGQVADVKIDAVLGGLTTSAQAGRSGAFDAIIYFDGSVLPRGGWNRVALTNPSTPANNTIGVCSVSTAVTGVTAGSHTIMLYSAYYNGTSPVSIGGDCLTSVNCGEVHAIVTYR